MQLPDDDEIDKLFSSEVLSLSRNDLDIQSFQRFGLHLQQFNNNLICKTCPYVATLTLKNIEDELQQSLQLKRQSLKKLQRKYTKRTRNVNVIQDIIIDDFEMAIADNVQLIPNAHADLMNSTEQENLLQLVIKQFEESIKSNTINNEIKNIYTFLASACNYKFTELSFVNENQQVLDSRMIYRIVQVWQIFEQYFKQFNYLDYLNNYNAIKSKTDIKFIATLLRILLDIGPIDC